MKKCIGFVCLYLICLSALAKDELPGIWNVGAGGQIYPLDAADSTLSGKLIIQKELIMVQLYPGFAVIKGEYRFLNTTDKPVKIQVGYPVSGQYPQQVVGNILFNDIYQFKVRSNAQDIIPARRSGSDISNAHQKPGHITNWYTWEQAFASDTITTLTVYFITQNNLARYIKGKESRDGNAFGFHLQTSPAWAGKTGIGQILVKLNDKLTLLEIQGILPDSQLTGDLHHLQYDFSLSSQGPENNLLIWYDGAPPDFKFDKKVLPSTDTLYQIMDNFPLSEFNNPAFSAISRKNFTLAKSGLTFSGVLYFLMFFMPWIILAVIIIFLVKGKKKIESGKSKIENKSPKVT
jgi:hypothetical protein